MDGNKMAVLGLPVVICLLVLSSVQGQEPSNPVIVSEGRNVAARVGDTVVLECSVDSLGTYVQSWRYLDHALPISSNDDVLTHDYRFSITRPLGDSHMRNLQIASIQAEDKGDYQCSILGTHESIIYNLTVSDAPVVSKPPTSALPPVNFTDCCRREGVSAPCLSYCDVSSVDLSQFDYNQCSGELEKYVKCGSDGRNHIPCCRQRLLPTQCLGFCMDDIPDDMNDDPTVMLPCLASTQDIIECYAEGQHLLPSPPVQFHAEAQSSSEIHASWQLPLENLATVTGYRLFYKRNGDVHYRSSRLLSSNELTYQLKDLEPNTDYILYVMAVNNHGSSLPSPKQQVNTFPRNPLPPGVERDTFEQCCEHRGVSVSCQPVLCGDGPMDPDVTMADCMPDVNKVFQCMSGERNHTACCVGQQVPDECLALCSGRVMGLDVHQYKCISLLPVISMCFNEGTTTIPGAPRSLWVTSVSLDEATIEWHEPLERADLIQRYAVRYWPVRRLDAIMEEYVPSHIRTVTLSGLTAGTEYFIEVFSVGEIGSSIPSPTVRIITQDPREPVSGSTPGPRPSPPANTTACCIENDVSPECLTLCDYDHDFESTDTALLLTCEQDLGKLFYCGTDGRNHTACCKERYVPDLCLDFCQFTEEMSESFSFSLDHLECLAVLDEITMCMKEGVVALPSPPRDLTVTRTTQTLTVSWQPPTRLPSGGGLQYRISWQQPEQEWASETVSATKYTIHNLRADTLYVVQVVSKTSEGESLPAPRLTVRTASESMPLNVTVPADLTSCCVTKGVSSQCISACSGSAVVDLQNCSSDMLRVIQCAADGRDHKPCCERSNLPDQCLSYCQADPKSDSFLHLICMTFIPQILSCFKEGYDTLPSPPVGFRAEEVGPKFARFAWDPPERNAQGVMYELYYSNAYQDTGYRTIQGVTSPYMLNNLNPIVPYTVFLIAYNNYGTSLPTNRVTFVTIANESPVIMVTQDPPDRYVKEGQQVVLSCHASGHPLPTIKWIRNGTEFNTHILRIGPLQPSDTGRYTCVAENNKQPVTQNVILNVQYAPHAVADQPVVYISPDMYHMAQLQCNILGFPEQVTWFKDGTLISEDHSSRYMTRREVKEEAGIIEAHFDIAAVSVVDFGVYMCKASSPQGSHDASIKLLDPTAVTLPPGMTVAPPVSNVTACCVTGGVDPKCHGACTFDIDLDKLLALPLSDQIDCLDQGEKILACAADGRNHTSCCVDKKIPGTCLPFCMGVVEEPLDPDQQDCLLYLDDIVSCMETGHAEIPTPPRNLRGRLINGFINLRWQVPEKNVDKVEYYDLVYQSPDSTQAGNITLDPSRLEYNLSGVHSMSLYTLYLEARNHYGTSHASNTISIQTYEMVPSTPYGLQGSALDAGEVRLEWYPPKQYYGAVVSYNVRYSVYHDHPHYEKVNTNTDSLHYVLRGLRPETNYSIYVTAVSSHYESLPSEVITVQTTELYIRGPDDQDKKNKLIIPVVSVLIVIAVITAVAIFVYWFLRVRRVPHQRFKDSVSFENPGYASRGAQGNGSLVESEARAWITGFPPETVMTPTDDVANKPSINGGVAGNHGTGRTPTARESRSDPQQSPPGVRTEQPPPGVNYQQQPVNGDVGRAYNPHSPGVTTIHSQGGATGQPDSSIMREVDTVSDQGYSTLSRSPGGATSPQADNQHSYATIDVHAGDVMDHSGNQDSQPFATLDVTQVDHGKGSADPEGIIPGHDSWF